MARFQPCHSLHQNRGLGFSALLGGRGSLKRCLKDTLGLMFQATFRADKKFRVRTHCHPSLRSCRPISKLNLVLRSGGSAVLSKLQSRSPRPQTQCLAVTKSIVAVAGMTVPVE
jgi:hypothetical protein